MNSIYKFIFSVFFTVLISGCATGADIYVDQNAANSSDRNPGTAARPLKTISRAAQIAVPGSRVIVRDGVYREWVKPQNSGTAEQPIVYQAENRHCVVIKGSKVYTDAWIAEEADHVFSTECDEDFFEGYNPFDMRRAAKFPDFVDKVTQYSLAQIFVDGELYNEVLSQETLGQTPRSWFKEPGLNKIYVHFENTASPDQSVIEISVRPRVFAPEKRGLGYIHVKGFVMEHCSNQYPRHFWESVENAQAGALGCGSGHHWVIEDNIVRLANMIGIDCGSETQAVLNGFPAPAVSLVGHHVIRNNLIENNGCTGIAGWNHTGTVVEGNVIRANNALGILSWETAGIKFHGFYNGVIENNLIEQNDAWGIWLDNVYKGSEVRSNLILNNLWGGIFLEMGDGSLDIVNNVIAYNISGNEAGHRGGHGIYGHDASGINVYHNLFYCNAGFGVTARIVADRKVAGKPAEASRWDVRNNFFVGNRMGNIALTVPCDRATGNVSDCNVFLNGGVNDQVGLFSLNSAITPSLKCDASFVKEYLEEIVVSRGSSPERYPFLKTWLDIPYLTFSQWQAVSGYDLNSKLLPRSMYTTIRQKTYQFHTTRDAGLYSTRFPAIEGVAEDYFGHAFEGDQVFAGPFAVESEISHLWPKLKKDSQSSASGEALIDQP